MEGDVEDVKKAAWYLNISIHSLRMEGDFEPIQASASWSYFNPLPPHGGRLFQSVRRSPLTAYFNPLPPHGGRLKFHKQLSGNIFISIHSLRMEGDRGNHHRNTDRVYFNPLPPHGGRLGQVTGTFADALFQSTPSAWRETKGLNGYKTATAKFQSTPSAWRETYEIGR